MLCPTCHGSGLILIRGQPLPCPECQGYGTVHCCDGLAEQPESSEPPVPPATTERPDRNGV